ncbi:ABC transporter ATP-binding protein [Halostella litorea]|uniref:ABC transporter ATP-binding protein n=1 Tax=Halostella litorea TaxID=2528831 RepID=UPI001091C684|nr:ABC transporter ATP-binding protein [Halostella litorea]
MVPAIELRNVEKRYGDVAALRGIDLTVESGEVYGFLGPNGAGKSTTIDVILNYVRPTSGEVRVLGHDAVAESERVRQRTGVLPDAVAAFGHLTPRQHLRFAAESKGVDADPDALLARVGIRDVADREVGGFSKGMVQRLLLAMALVGEPDLLILDEPSTGLDPNGARDMREIVREERDRGATVFFSSHILGQVEAVCDRVGILRDGELVAQDSIEGLRETAGTEATLRVTTDGVPDGALGAVRAVDGVTGVAADGHTVTVRCGPGAKLPALDALRDAGVAVRDFETERASLEDLFDAHTRAEAAEVSA